MAITKETWNTEERARRAKKENDRLIKRAINKQLLNKQIIQNKADIGPVKGVNPYMTSQSVFKLGPNTVGQSEYSY